MGFFAYGAAVCSALLALTYLSGHVGIFWLSLVPFFLGMGLVFPSATAIALEPLPNIAGFASSLLGTMQILVAVAGAAVTGFFYDGTAASLLAVVTAGCVAAVAAYFFGKTYVGASGRK